MTFRSPRAKEEGIEGRDGIRDVDAAVAVGIPAMEGGHTEIDRERRVGRHAADSRAEQDGVGGRLAPVPAVAVWIDLDEAQLAARAATGR